MCEPIREMTMHATHYRMLVHSYHSLLSHCGLVLGLKEWNWCALADLYFKKTAVRQRFVKPIPIILAHQEKPCTA